MKGLELPVNALIIIIIAIIVLIAVIVLFIMGWDPTVITINVEGIKANACSRLNQQGCGDPNEIINLEISLGDDGKPGTADDTLQKLCDKYYGCKGDTDCCKYDICRCK